jgi:hypothetical protein
MQIRIYADTNQQKTKRIYSYFHDTIEECQDDAYSGALEWLESEFNLIIDIKTNQKLKDVKERLQVANTRAGIVEDLYIKTRDECRALMSKKSLAMNEMLTTAEKMPILLWLSPNTTPLKAPSEAYPYMIYTGSDPPRNEKEQLAKCLSEVFSTLRI